MKLLRDLKSIRYYALAAALAYGTFVWAGLRGTRLLGDDNENTENLNGNSSHGGSGGHARFYHK
ncbi:hypothetical protein MTX78_06740 [Hymenobacter tibetensis]|uniref:Uncharacterized protein n=1 Tax=Hymenobacter tibetensis TaxID=497967 RepID=A0ABY4D1W0_9BACT|nr:hypothetical protein [Hymenobacter tibetensis]UOG76291.1 hypothetical protein MTX78_06740 [Hymenobacter tibetensis]